MRRTSILAALAALTLTAACAGPGPTEARRSAAAHRDETPPPPDTSTTKCNGMIGSGTRC
jgi:hypothetical protein